ncbi:hypothetical protein [Microbacterium paludicola]|uniref:hypothetical protein n=1 Tax=Microbacterium paludicola TaxID=300019 RepID=UPI0031E3DFD8
MSVISIPPSDARRRGGSTSQTATRVLVLLDVLGTPVPVTCDVESAVAVMSSLIRLQKLDFWLRNPDYLADELLTDFENGILRLDQVQPHVVRMLSGNAPQLHTYPMERYIYGAYEFIDDALAVLKLYGQIVHRRSADSGPASRRDYFLLEKGRETIATMRAEIPDLAWYDRQANAIGLIADAAIGATAKRRQYLQAEYAGTAHGDVIPSILERVGERAVALNVMEA